MSPPTSEDRERAPAIALLVTLLAADLVAACRGGFRADDWINLERGQWSWTAAGAHAVWTSLNPFTLYRPLVDLWHGLMLALFGLSAPPMMFVLAGVLLLQSVLLARLVRAHGGSRAIAALAAAAVWAQPNTYAWTTLWVSNATGALMATGALLALLLYTRAARALARGRGAALTLLAMSVVFVAGALCKEEIVLLPAAVIALEWPRWHSRTPAERRARAIAWGALVLITLAYTIFRTRVLVTPQAGENRYHLRLGMHVLNNLRFFAMHLGAMPLGALLFARVLLPGAFAPGARDDAAWAQTRAAMLGGFGWAAAALLLYLPIAGRPAYGYLYIPAFGIAYAVAHGLAFAARAHARTRPARSAALPLAAHAALATALTITALAGIGWQRYPELAASVEATLRREQPAPPPHARLLFLDLGGEHETFAGRSLFNLIFDDASGSFLRLLYRRDDLDAVVLHGPADRAWSAPPGTVAVYRADHGRIFEVPAGVVPDSAAAR